MEQGVIGCILLSPQDCLPVCVTRLGAGPEAFYDLRHQTIYKEIVEMGDRREPVDIITVMQRLKDLNLLEQVGGIPYLNYLQDSVPSAANVTYYTDIVQEKFMLRKLITTCSEIVSEVYEHEGDVDSLLDVAERDILSVRGPARSGLRPDIRQVTHAAIARIEDKFNRRGAIAGLPTGFPDLDQVLDGLCPTDLIVPSAFTSGGKTVLSTNFAEHVALNLREPAVFFSLEMGADQLASRILCSQSRVNLRDIARGELADAAFPRLTSAAGRLANSGLHIVDDTNRLGAIVAEARRYHQQHRVKLVVVDYIQIVENDRAKKGANREQEVAGVANALKALAMELKVPVVAPSQLNREGNLRESDAVGQAANVVLLIESKVPEGEENQYVDSEPVDVLVKKNRNGPRNVRVPLTFLKQYTRFESAAKVDDRDVPQD